MENCNLYAVRNVKNDGYENAMVSESDKIIIAGFKNMLAELGQRYLPLYLVYPSEYELILVSHVDFGSKSAKSDWKSLGLISDLLKGDSIDEN